jgi:hypothetical protein
MTETLIMGGLASLHPKSVWISKGRTAACISDLGIVSCIYHGNQAVSRNSYILKGSVTEPAVGFVFSKNGKTIKHEVVKCIYSIENCRLEIKVLENFLFIDIRVFNEALLVSVSPIEDYHGPEIGIELRTSGFSRDVYGNRKWKIKINEEQGFVRLYADDRTRISEWLPKHGPFLVPIEIQNIIYEKDPVSDISFSENPPLIKDGYSDILLVNGQTTVDIVCREAPEVSGDSEHIVFKPDISINGKTELKIGFSYKDTEDSPVQDFTRDFTEENCIDGTKEKPVLIYPDSKPLEELFSFIPTVMTSVIQDDSGMPRACAGGYYWVWGWDTIVSAMEMSKWGQSKQQKRIISFMLEHRWNKSSVPHRFGRSYEAINVKPGITDSLFLLLVKQYIEDSKDYEWLVEIYDDLKQIWSSLLTHADENGFITGLGTYPDNPRAMGRNTLSRVAIDSGSFYFALSIMMGFAKRMKDNKILDECRNMLEGFEQRYINGFFDEEKKMVFDSFSPSGRNLTFPLYSLVSMSCRPGIPLLLQKSEMIAEFLESEYIEKHGFRALPSWDSNKDTECIHHSWFPYWDVCIFSLLRTTGHFTSIDIYRNNIDLMWQNYRTVFEFLDLDDINLDDDKYPWNGYGCSWPIHGMASVYRGILEGLLGLRIEMGYITILPGPVADGSLLKNITVAGKKWNFEFNGDGGHIRNITVNGNALERCMVIPESMLDRKDIQVVILRGHKKPKDFYIADIFGGKIQNLSHREKGLGLLVKSDGVTTILIQADVRPSVKLESEELQVSGIEGCKDIHIVQFNKSGNLIIE